MCWCVSILVIFVCKVAAIAAFKYLLRYLRCACGLACASMTALSLVRMVWSARHSSPTRGAAVLLFLLRGVSWFTALTASAFPLFVYSSMNLGCGLEG